MALSKRTKAVLLIIGTFAVQVVGSVLILSWMIIVFTGGPVSSWWVCDFCGVVKHATGLPQPLIPIRILGRTTIESTPVSEELANAGIPRDHVHHWVFVETRSGKFFAGGRGLELIETATSPEVARLIGSARRNGSREMYIEILRRAFVPATTASVRSLAASLPQTDFEDGQDFAEWLADNLWATNRTTQLREAEGCWEAVREIMPKVR